jgi:hypothetical protein
MELLLLVFGTVNVDVSSWLLRSDNASVLKGNLFAAWYWFRNKALEKRSSVSCILRAKRELLFRTSTSNSNSTSMNTTQQECEDQSHSFARGRGPRPTDLVGPVGVLKKSKRDCSWTQSIG